MKTTRRIFLFLLPLFLIAVSLASVLQQRFCLKKRMMQTEEELFKEGETMEGVLAAVIRIVVITSKARIRWDNSVRL
ncbi:hypothetical protein [Bacteroides sp.]|uniref:hypothetical protein n=1 Tax=Bacteroides sp. TaxID=29523 RepID=UPI0023BBEAAE|nr:hypothetical protein [Bacteroides sp.]MDE5760062.1 hypothetical protein [Bacteroides sp.]MDE6216199.1 hypothetical protein [Bacteroides sp.]